MIAVVLTWSTGVKHSPDSLLVAVLPHDNKINPILGDLVEKEGYTFPWDGVGSEDPNMSR